MENSGVWYSKRSRDSLVLDVSPSGFDKGSVAFASVFIDHDYPNKVLLYYTGAEDAKWSRSSIGLAVSNDATEFQKISSNPIFEGPSGSFCSKEAMTPVVTRVGNRFYMVFAGRPSLKARRRIGIAYADDPEGPWGILGEILKPSYLWEGMHIDLGPSVARLDETTFLVFFSSVTTYSKLDFQAILRRYPIRRIGLAKVRILGPSLSQIEVYKLPTNPLKYLNGSKGSWNESVFCPGYFWFNDVHYLLPAASTYSVGAPFKQYIGLVPSETPYFQKASKPIQKLIDGPSEKAQIIPNVKSEIALDSPSPFISEKENKLFLYYSVADRADYIWKIALTTFDLQNTQSR